MSELDGHPSDVERLLGRAAASGLIGDRLPPATVPTHHAGEFLAIAERHRIMGLVQHSFERGDLVTDPSTIEAATERHLAALRTSLRCEAAAAWVTQLLTTAGVESRALKGIAMAHLDYDDPALRVFGDADILVRRRDLDRALALLQCNGFVRTSPPVRSWWERRYGKAVELHDGQGVELDVHLTITGGFHGLAIAGDDLFTEGETFQLAGVAVTALPRHLRLVHAAYHVVLGGGSGLRAERDVAQLAIDERTTAAASVAARRWQGEQVLATAIRRSWTSLSLPPEHPSVVWARGCVPSATDEHRMAASSGGADGWATEGRAALTALRWFDRAGYLVGLAFPSRASLRARGRSLPQQFRRVWSLRRG